MEAERFDQLDVYVLLLETDTDFDSLLQEADFPTVAETEAYARGRMAEAAHDNKGAIAYYQQCGAMLDSLARMRTLLLATPAPTEVPTPTPTESYQTLRLGDVGVDVRNLQSALYELYYYGDIVDGVYDETTRDAVRLFQVTNDLFPAEGIADSKTLMRLYSGNAAPCPTECE